MTSTQLQAHFEDHHIDPDRSCDLCLEEWDWLGEAQDIYEGKSMLSPEKRHLIALFERIEELENALAEYSEGDQCVCSDRDRQLGKQCVYCYAKAVTQGLRRAG